MRERAGEETLVELASVALTFFFFSPSKKEDDKEEEEMEEERFSSYTPDKFETNEQPAHLKQKIPFLAPLNWTTGKKTYQTIAYLYIGFYIYFGRNVCSQLAIYLYSLSDIE